MKLVIVFVAAILMSFVATAMAADVTITLVNDSSSVSELLNAVLAAVTGGHYLLAASLGVIMLVGLLRKYGGSRFPFLMTDHGGAILVLVTSFFGAISTALMAGAMPTLALAWTALGVAVTAAGGYSLVKKLLAPLVPKAPAWLRPVLNVVLWFFDRRSDQTLKAAKKAGDAAVAANPPTGVDGVVGKPTDVP